MMTDNYCFNLNKTLKVETAALKVRTAAIACWILLLCLVLPMPLHAAEEKPEARQQHSSEKNGVGADVVAKVNGVEITQEELKTKMLRMIETRKSDPAGGEIDPEALRKEALSKLVLRELAYQRAKAEGIKIGGDELDNAIAEIKAKVDEDKYRETLEKNQMTEKDLREDLEKNLMVKHIFEKEVSSLVTVSEEEVQKEYKASKEEFTKPQKLVVADFVMFINEDDKSAPDKAADLIRKIKNYTGKNVLDLPTDGTFAVRELSLFNDKQPELYAEAKKLSEGEVSGLIRTPDSFHVIKLLKYSPEVTVPLSQVHGFVENRVRARKQQKKTAEWEAELKKNARIEIVDAEGNGK